MSIDGSAPIVLFTYNRLKETRKTVSALQQNVGAESKKLFIFSDGPKTAEAAHGVMEVRDYLHSITGFDSVSIVERTENYGLSKSIIEGISKVFEDHEKIIVMEDDILTSQNFLAYVDQALAFYQGCEKVWSVSGFSFPFKYPDDYAYDVAFGYRASAWGWATWKDRWQKIDWNVSDYDAFKDDPIARKNFRRGGSDMCKMLNDEMTGKINSWDIRFCYNQFRHGMYDVFPVRSKVQNIGFSPNATHTKNVGNRFKTVLDTGQQTTFRFPENAMPEESIMKQFRKRNSIPTRILSKLRGFVR